jgi:hypothetical protein
MNSQFFSALGQICYILAHGGEKGRMEPKILFPLVYSSLFNNVYHEREYGDKKEYL